MHTQNANLVEQGQEQIKTRDWKQVYKETRARIFKQ